MGHEKLSQSTYCEHSTMEWIRKWMVIYGQQWSVYVSIMNVEWFQSQRIKLNQRSHYIHCLPLLKLIMLRKITTLLGSTLHKYTGYGKIWIFAINNHLTNKVWLPCQLGTRRTRDRTVVLVSELAALLISQGRVAESHDNSRQGYVYLINRYYLI